MRVLCKWPRPVVRSQPCRHLLFLKTELSRALMSIRRGIFGLMLCGACVMISTIASAANGTVAIVYPEIREPFRSVFLNIAQGVNERLNKEAITRTYLDDGTDMEELRSWIDHNDIHTVIALGSRGRVLSDKLSGLTSVVLGAVHMSPELDAGRYQGIALSPEPALLLERLKQLAPEVTKVNLVYHRERDKWMIERARAPAARLGIEINAVPVDRLQEAASAYRAVLGAQSSRTEALWLSQDSAVLDEQAVLPLILREAWDRQLIVFSSNPAHVRRGVLFALYPDNVRMGHSLGALAETTAQRANSPDAERMALLTDVSMAFNIRTAGHLGIRYNRKFLEDVQLVFPLM